MNCNSEERCDDCYETEQFVDNTRCNGRLNEHQTMGNILSIHARYISFSLHFKFIAPFMADLRADMG